MKRTLQILFGTVAVLIGMAFVMPALAQWKHEGAMTNSSIALFLLGSVMTLVGIGAAIRSAIRCNV